MKTTKLIFVLIILVSMVSMTHAQRMGKGMNQNYGSGYHGYYIFDLNSPFTIQGKIMKIERLNLGSGRYANGISLIVKNGKKETLVHIGPIAFLNGNNFEFKEGENVKIKVFKGAYNNNTALFAAEVYKSGKNLILRDNNGLPLWRLSLYRGWGAGNRGWPRGNYGWGARGRGWPRGNYGWSGRGRGRSGGNFGWGGRGFGRSQGIGYGYGRGNIAPINTPMVPNYEENEPDILRQQIKNFEASIGNMKSRLIQLEKKQKKIKK